MPFDVSHVMDASGGEHATIKTGIKTLASKALGEDQIEANGTVIQLGDPAAAAKFAVIKAKAIEQGTYEGKGLKFGEGGRAKMFYDQLRVDGRTHEQAQDIVKINFFNKLKQQGR